MKIRLDNRYQGADIPGKTILPGEYEIDSEFLYGIGQSLVNDGVAVIIEDEEDLSDDSLTPDTPTLKELKALAAERGITVSGRTKADYIAALGAEVKE